MTQPAEAPRPDWFVLGVSAGDHSTPTALTVLAITHAGASGPVPVVCVHTDRVPAGTGYPDQAAHVAAIVAELLPASAHRTVRTVLEVTMLGAPIVRLFETEARKAGAGVEALALPEGGGRRGGVNIVPRRDLIDGLALMLQNRTLTLPRNDDGNTLADLLRTYQHPTPGAAGGGDPWRVHERDDLVLALAVAARTAARPLSRIGSAANVSLSAAAGLLPGGARGVYINRGGGISGTHYPAGGTGTAPNPYAARLRSWADQQPTRLNQSIADWEAGRST